jgi:DivIVA domain-containing protein
MRLSMRVMATIVTSLGVAIFVAGLWLNLRADATPDGEQVPAKIVAVYPSRLWIFDGAEMDVEYTLGSKIYRARLTQSRWQVPDYFPKHLNVYIDPTDPTNVSTIEGYISDGFGAWLARVPLIFGVPIMAMGSALTPRRRRVVPEGHQLDELLNVEVIGDFDVVVRGYDRMQVSLFVQSAQWAVSHADDVNRQDVLDEIRNARFDVVLRGFDRRQVDRYVAEARNSLNVAGPLLPPR